MDGASTPTDGASFPIQPARPMQASSASPSGARSQASPPPIASSATNALLPS